MSALQRRLIRTLSDQIVKVHGTCKSCFQYADDIKLIAGSEHDLDNIFGEVAKYLRFLGLTIAPGKS
jgi:hypothetical protein